MDYVFSIHCTFSLCVMYFNGIFKDTKNELSSATWGIDTNKSIESLRYLEKIKIVNLKNENDFNKKFKAFISNSINEINNSKDNYENILLFFKFYRSINLWVRKVKMNKGIFESNNNKIDLENSNELFYKNFNSSIISKPII